MKYFSIIESPLGNITAVSADGALTNLYLPTQSGPDLSNAVLLDNEPVLAETRQWLRRYFLGERLPCHIPMAPAGTPFQKTIWDLLRLIPYGTAVTYGDLAGSFPGRMSAQAIGQAIGHNPISILIPCHRVLGKNRKLTGYTGGLEIKTYLLDLEGIPYQE